MSLSSLRVQAVALLGIGGLSLATAPKAQARADEYTCGVCYEGNFCAFNPGGDCASLCGYGPASECLNGIPGGWVCEGSGVYASFVYCGVA